MAERASFLSPLRHDSFRRIWLAYVASNLGGLIQGVGAAWLMTAITTSPNMVALVQASMTFPIMLFSLVSGAIGDNFDRRRVMLIAQFFMCAVSTILAALTFLGHASPWLILGFTFLLGCGTALNNPAWQASIGDMVPRSDVPAAVSLNSMGFNLTRSVGPAIGGAIVAVGGAAFAFAVNALSYVALVLVLLRWKPERQPRTVPREDIWHGLLAGLRYVAMSPNLLRVAIRSLIFGLAAVSLMALLPVITRDTLSGGPLTYGLMLGGFGLGAVGGAYLNTGLRELLSTEALVRITFSGFALSAAAIAVLPSTIVIAMAVALAGACWVMSLSLFNTIVQLSSPRWVVARSLAFYQTVTFGGMAGGSWLWGTIAEHLGTGPALLMAAGILLFGAALGVLLPMPKLASLDLDPLNQFREPPLSLDIKPRSGPIAIHVRYLIADEDLTVFLEIMAERRRIRIRDGAQAWVLMRDLQHPQVWIESYHTPTWVDYVRHNSRRTRADADNTERLRALHKGDWPPEVQRMIERQVIPPQDDVFYKPESEPH